MKIFFEKIEVESSKRFDFIKLDSQVEKIIKESGVKEGTVFLFCPHTTAALVCNEADPTIHRDFEKVFNKLVPEDLAFEHIMEGIANARAHQLAMILGNTIFTFIKNGKLDLGTWQSLFFIELLEPRKRKVKVLVLGD